MEPVKLASVTELWSVNTTALLPTDPSECPSSAVWEMVRTIIPPYIFTVSLLGLLLNSFVLLVFLAHKDRLTVAEIYLSNLALADFTQLCGLPFWAVYILNDFDWPYGDALCKIVNSVIAINFYTSIFTLVMISVDRYLAIVTPMRSRVLRQTRYAKLVCLFLWILGLFMNIPTMVHRKTMFSEELQTTSCTLDYSHCRSWKLTHQILLNVVGFLIPLLIIVFCSWSIVKVLAQRKDSITFQDSNDAKATVLVYAVTVLFLLCWGPFQVFTFLHTLCDIYVLNETLWSQTLDIGGQVSVYLAFLNSALNPVLYVTSGQYFRRKVSAICRRSRHRQRGSDMTTYQRSIEPTNISRVQQIKTMVIINAMDQM